MLHSVFNVSHLGNLTASNVLIFILEFTVKRETGFTLIELLVVIAVIALLLAIVTPALRKAKRFAQLTICRSNQHQLGLGVIAYTVDWNSKLPPPVARGGRPCVLNRRQSNTAVYPSLGSYLPLAEVFNCPASSFSATSMVSTPGGDFSYQHLYENPRDDFNLNSSYLLLWNYNGFDNNASARRFKGPGNDSDNKLLACDAFIYSHNLQGGGILPDHWVSTHPFKKDGFKKRTSEFPYFFLSGNSYRMQAVTGYAAMYIPRVWK